VRVELQRPNISGTPLASSLSLSIGFHKIRGLARRLLTIPSSRCCPKEISPPTLVEESIPQLTSHQQRPPVTLNSYPLNWPCIVNTSLKFLRNGEHRGRTSGVWTSPMGNGAVGWKTIVRHAGVRNAGVGGEVSIGGG
jgi:hypothetical protein